MDKVTVSEESKQLWRSGKATEVNGLPWAATAVGDCSVVGYQWKGGLEEIYMYQSPLAQSID